MTKHGRAASRIATAKLTREEVRLLRLQDSQGLVSPAAEAKRFGVGVETIRRALRGDTYQDVPFPDSERPVPRILNQYVDEPTNPAGLDPTDPAAANSARRLLEALDPASPPRSDPAESSPAGSLSRFIEETRRLSPDDIIN